MVLCTTTPCSVHAAPVGDVELEGQATHDARIVLARPLFAKDRRPPPEQRASAQASAEALPRLSGIIIAASYRRAIFDSHDHPAAYREGDVIGRYTILAIASQQVTLTGPDGQRVVGLSFDTIRPGNAGSAAFQPNQSILDRLNSHVPYRPAMPKMPTSEEFIARMTQQTQQAPN